MPVKTENLALPPDFTPVSEGVLRWSAFLKSFLALGDWSQSFHFISSVSLAVSLFNIIGTFLNGAQLSRLLLPHCTHECVEDVTSIMVAHYSLCSVNLKRLKFPEGCRTPPGVVFVWNSLPQNTVPFPVGINHFHWGKTQLSSSSQKTDSHVLGVFISGTYGLTGSLSGSINLNWMSTSICLIFSRLQLLLYLMWHTKLTGLPVRLTHVVFLNITLRVNN